ncbi:MAG TPA: S8 family serine peptidase [Ignavibacteria bacterium]|nr:S8 family serine peptidase [Ignavibacteria bacterium]
MKKILLLVFLLIGISVSAETIIHPDLLTKMNSAAPNEKIPIMIVFNSHLTLSDFNDISYDTPKKERRSIVIDRLIRFSDNSQNKVRSFVASKMSAGSVEKYEVLWMINRIAISTNTETINQLASGFPEIAMLTYDPSYPIEELYDYRQPSPPFVSALVEPQAVEIGCQLMNADDCWLLGNRGKGAFVANADDGFHWRHPDLVKGVYQNLGEDANNNGMTVIWGSGTTSTFDPGDVNGVDNDGNGKVDDLIGWDFTTNNYNITTASHGSATLGHVVGDGTMGTQTGVAPDSKCLLLRNGSGQSEQMAAFQYAFLMGVDVVTSSLSWKWNMSPKPDYSAMRLVTDISLAGGMIHTNSTSNNGNSLGIPMNIATAGNCPPPWLHPDQTIRGNLSGAIGVGNVTCSTDIIASSSPYGPTTWGNWALWGTYTYTIDPSHKDYPYSRVAPIEPDSVGLKKPDISAPGEGSTSTYVSSGTGYGTFGGTSSATPHTGGLVALMLSINPEMLPRDISKVMELTAVEKGDPGKDYRYGSGRIDALAATTSPKFTLSGINGGSNMVMNTTLAPSDTARELAGLKIITSVNPQVGSLKILKFGMTTNASATNITSFDLYFDKDKNNLVSAGDVKLKSIPFTTGPLTFDSIKFKFIDSSRTLILAARTTSSATGSMNVNLGITDTNQVIAYYTTRPFSTNFPFGSVTGVTNPEQTLTYSLSQNYPNPFNPSTVISYSIAKESFVTIKVYDLLGREVATLINSKKLPGNYQVEFDSRDYKNLSSSLYFYRIQAGDFTEVKRMMLIK